MCLFEQNPQSNFDSPSGLFEKEVNSQLSDWIILQQYTSTQVHKYLVETSTTLSFILKGSATGGGEGQRLVSYRNLNKQS